jgi:preprotein translocase subunit SecA
VRGKLGLKEGEAITHSLITKSLERAQQKVEANNYDIRKQILKFDDILNDQRKIIYQNRKEILTTKDQSKIVNEMIDDYIDELITICIPAKKYSHEWDSELLRSSLEETFKINLPISNWFEEDGVDEEEIIKRVKDQVNQKLKDKKNKYSEELFEFAEKRVMLFQLDKDWREHLAAMDMLRGSVNLRAMGGKDPFFEYKNESFNYFDEMLSNQNERVLKTLFGLELISENKDSIKDKQPNRIITKKIGRNDPCPCGSGKKYKVCHGS